MSTTTQVIKTTFQFRRGLSEVLRRKNILLAEGEPAFELDTNKLKVGDGKTLYNDLPYINGVDVQTIKEQFSQKNTTAYWKEHKDYVPEDGCVIIYSDYKQISQNGVMKNIPSMKIGDGVTPVDELCFTNQAPAASLEHALKIGEIIFDGTKDVEVPVYSGEIK